MGAKIVLKGRLGGDPTFGETKDHKPWVSFSMHQDHMVRSGQKLPDGRDEYVDNGGFWMQVVWFSRKAEKAAQLLKKGAAVIVTGDLRTEQWENKETGELQAGFKVVADEVALDMLSLDNVSYVQQRQAAGAQPQPNIGQRSNKSATHSSKSATATAHDHYAEPYEQDQLDDDDMPF